MEWSLVYERAIRLDGTLLFPERLTHEFLQNARRTMGSYLFANQYQNEVIPEDEKRFKKDWIKCYASLPETRYTFGFIDPAIGQKKHHDYTGVVIIDVDTDGHWYVRVANRYRLTPTEIVSKMFEIQEQFNLRVLGIESVGYQEALLYLASEEMRRREKVLPLHGIKRSNISKETRILGLAPRFEWGMISLAHGLVNLEDELSAFPRGKFDDLLDSLASIEEFVNYPEKKKENLDVRPHSPQDPNYERWYRRHLSKQDQHDHESVEY